MREVTEEEKAEATKARNEYFGEPDVVYGAVDVDDDEEGMDTAESEGSVDVWGT